MKPGKYRDRIVPVFDLFLKRDAEVYAYLYDSIRSHIKGHAVLEIGAGTGVTASSAASEAASYTACDPSERLLRTAGKKSLPSNVFLIHTEGSFLPFADREFDDVILGSTPALFEDPSVLLKEAGRVLKKDGSLYVTAFVRGTPSLRETGLLKVMNLQGILSYLLWSEEEVRSCLVHNGWKIREEIVLEGSLPLYYCICAKH